MLLSQSLLYNEKCAGFILFEVKLILQFIYRIDCQLIAAVTPVIDAVIM